MSKFLENAKKQIEAEKKKDPKAFAKKYAKAPVIIEREPREKKK